MSFKAHALPLRLLVRGGIPVCLSLLTPFPAHGMYYL